MSPQPDHLEPSLGSEGPKGARHLVITVHGIRTFGQWQERLEKLLPAEEGLQVKHYRYGYFSVLAFLVPVLRWLVTRRFRRELLSEARANPGARIDLVAHSFGTHLVAWALLGLRKDQRPHVHTVILAGSVLKVGFSWRLLMDDGKVKRVINECGIDDSVLLLNQLFVLFTGMAGRVGFNGMTERERFLNRYFPFGHSDYFLRDGQPDDDFMREWWVPLLTTEGLPKPTKPRPQPGLLRGLELFLLNNAEPVKLAVYLSPLVALVLVYYGLYRQAETARQEQHRLYVEAEKARAETEYTAAVGLLRPLEAQSGGLTPREVEALTQLASLPKPQEPVRTRFVEAGLSDPGSAVRFANRAPAAVQAAVGLDPARRTEVTEVLRKHLGDANAHLSVRVAAALAAVELELEDGPLNGQATGALAEVFEKGDKTVPIQTAVSGIIYTTRSLPPGQRAAFLGPAVQALADALGKESHWAARPPLVRALTATVRSLPPETAATLLADALGRETGGANRQARVKGLAAGARALPPAIRAKLLADALRKETDPFTRWALAAELAAAAEGRPPTGGRPDPLVEPVDSEEGPAVAAAGLPQQQRAALLGPAAQVLADALRKEKDSVRRLNLANGLGTVSQGLPAEAGAQVLADALREDTYPDARRSLAEGLVAVAKGLRREDRVKVLADALAKETERGGVWLSLFGGLVVAAEGLPPGQQAAFLGRPARELADALAKETNELGRWGLGMALEAAAKRLPPAVAVEMLTDALAKETPPFRGSLAQWRGEAASRLPPEAAVKVLTDALAKETNREVRRSLARCWAQAASRLPPATAVEVLAGALTKETDVGARRSLAEGLVAAAKGLPAEAGAQALADALAKETAALPKRAIVAGLAAVTAGLPQQQRPEKVLVEGLAVVAVGLPQQQRAALLGPRARALADALAEEPDRVFRAYLATLLPVAAAGLPQQQRAALLGPAAQALAGALAKETDVRARRSLAEGLVAVAAGLPPEARLKVLPDALAKETDLGTRRYLARSLAAKGLPSAAAVEALAAALAKETDGMVRQYLAEGLAAAARGLPAEVGARVLADALAKETAAPPEKALVAGLAGVAAGLPEQQRAALLGPRAQALANAFAKETDREGRAYLATLLAAAAKGLPPQQRIAFLGPAARALADALRKEEIDAKTRQTLAEELVAAAEDLLPEQRAALLEPAAQALADAPARETNSSFGPTHVTALVAVAKGLRPETAVRMLAGALPRESNPASRQALVKELEAAAGRLPLGRSIPVLLPYIASSNDLAKILAPTLRTLAQRCSLEESVEALKNPFCCGEERALFLRRAEQLTGQTFRTRWELVDWLRQNHPEIDLSTPPHLEE